MHGRDRVLLSKVQSFFGVGNITVRSRDNCVIYTVKSTKDITTVIIPHFMQYPLLSQKRADFELWRSVVELINKGEHLTTQGLTKILSIRASINKGLTKELTNAFPNIIPVNRPLIENTKTPDPATVVGPPWNGGGPQPN